MDSQIRISDLENVISEKVFIKIEKWNLYLGDAGLARHLAIFWSILLAFHLLFVIIKKPKDTSKQST